MQSLLILLEQSLELTLVIAGLFGLLFGSFLNVVIYRIPLMLQQEQLQQYSLDTFSVNDSPITDIAQNPTHETIKPPRFNLAWPNSHCPTCNTPIKAWQNIPVVSYLLLKGHCHHCHTAISIQYPIVEIISAFLAIISVLNFGLSAQGLVLFFVSLTLLALAVIDLNTFLLPDRLTLPLLWSGLLYQSLYHPHFLTEAVWGAATGYLILWSIYWLFKLITNKEGMGYGDFKLLAALGAWLGVLQLPSLLLISALSGLMIALLYKLKYKGHQGGTPFGPALALSGWLCLSFPDTVRSVMTYLFY